MVKKKRLDKLRGFSIQFLPYSEIKELDTTKRLRKILNIVLGNNILILQGRLEPEEETRLIEDTMVMMGHVKNFRDFNNFFLHAVYLVVSYIKEETTRAFPAALKQLSAARGNNS